MTFFLKLVLILVLAHIVSLSLYLLVPSPESWFVEIGEFPPDAPIAVNAEIQCRPRTLYVTKDYAGSADQEVLDDRCFELQEKLVKAASDGDVSRIAALIAEGANVNSLGWLAELERPLPGAVWSRQTAAVKLMLDNGGDPDDYQYCCMSHKSLLTIAAGNNDVETMKLLISRGADLHFVGDFGEGVAETVKREGNEQTMELFNAACDRDIRWRVRSRAVQLLSVLGLSKIADAS